LNPTSGSWWVVQAQPTKGRHFFESHQRKLVDCSNPAFLGFQRKQVGLEQSTSFRWWDSGKAFLPL